MNRRLALIFENQKNMIVTLVLAGIFVFANALYSFAGMNIIDKLLAFERIFIFIMLLITVISYFKHEKNIMKCTVGATLGATIIAELTTLLLKGVTPINIVGLIIPTVILISHLAINSDHHSNPLKIKFNQIFLLISTIVLLALCVYSVIKNGWNLQFARDLSLYLFYISSIITLVIIESKLDAYRINREMENK